ncbi:MAG: hypothetical protein E6R03_02340 [Hyphomicrobiaceae bacterium]|nr:MAG: hypothetical protein E6R03_02340 [Hyphomicrobiaceae bacterium]
MFGFNPIGTITDFILGQDDTANDLAPKPNNYNTFGLNFSDTPKLIEERNKFDPLASFSAQREQFSDAIASSNLARAQQQTFAEQLAAQALGQAPSLAESQLKQAMDQNLKQQAALASSQLGANSGLALRRVLDSTAAANQQLSQAATQQRLVERLAAQQLYGNTLSALRGGDLQSGQLVGNFGLGVGQLAAQNRANQDSFLTNLYGLANQRDLGLGNQDSNNFSIKSGNINALNKNRVDYQIAQYQAASNAAKAAGGGG